MGKQLMGHGDRPNFDIHLANGSFRVAITPKGRAKDHQGNVLPEDPNRYSILSKENDEDPKDSTREWPAGTAAHRKDARSSWGEFLEDPRFKEDKLKQIQRSCPTCRSML